MFKNQLQQLAQKSGHPLPIYTTVMEGLAHSPQFKTSVVVEGVRFEPPEKFSSKKEAEQHAARVAYEELQKKERDPLQLIGSRDPLQLIGSRDLPQLIGSRDPLQLIGSDVTFCKTILQEFSVKMSLQKPEYKCFQAEGLLPAFFSTVELSGSVFEGVIGRNKGESNQLAARAAIQSILAHGYPEWKTMMTQIVRSKSKLYAAIGQCQTKVDPDGPVVPPRPLIRPVGPIGARQTNIDPDGRVAQPQPPITQREQPPNREPRSNPVGPIGQIKIKPDPDGDVSLPEPLVARQEQLPDVEPRKTLVGPGGQSQTDVDRDGHVAQSQPPPNGESLNIPVGSIGLSQLTVDPDGHVAQSQLLVQSEEQPNREPLNTPVGPCPDGHVVQSQPLVELEEQHIRGTLNTPVGPGSQPLIDPSGDMAQSQPLIGQQEEQSKEEALSIPNGPGGKSQNGVVSSGQRDEKVYGGVVKRGEEPETEDPKLNALTSEEKVEESVEEPETENSDRSGNVKRLKITIM